MLRSPRDALQETCIAAQATRRMRNKWRKLFFHVCVFIFFYVFHLRLRSRLRSLYILHIRLVQVLKIWCRHIWVNEKRIRARDSVEKRCGKACRLPVEFQTQRWQNVFATYSYSYSHLFIFIARAVSQIRIIWVALSALRQACEHRRVCVCVKCVVYVCEVCVCVIVKLNRVLLISVRATTKQNYAKQSLITRQTMKHINIT